MEGSQIPPNILKYIKESKDKITGKPQTLAIIGTRMSLFNQMLVQNEQISGIKVEPYRDDKGNKNSQIYKLTIKGRFNTHYQYRVVKIYMFLFDGFPYQPPQFVFENVKNKEGKWVKFLHLNVDGNGLLCQNINKTQYQPSLKMMQILEQIQNTLYNTNINSAYDGPLYTSYDRSTPDGGPKYNKILAQFSTLLDMDSDDDD